MSTRIAWQDDEQIIADLIAGERRLRQRLAAVSVRGGHDLFTVAATPLTDYPLTYIPVQGTCELAKNGDELREGTDYTVDYDLTSVTAGHVTVSASLTSGDKLIARYLVTDWLVARSLPPEVDGIEDTFNRPDSPTDVNPRSDGGLWTVLGATVAGISSNQGIIVSGGGTLAAAVIADAGFASQDIIFTETRPSTSGASAVLFGYDPGGSGGFYLLFDSGSFFQVQGAGGTSSVNVTGYTAWTGGTTTIRVTFNAITGAVALYQNGAGAPFWTHTLTTDLPWGTYTGWFRFISGESIDYFKAVPL